MLDIARKILSNLNYCGHKNPESLKSYFKKRCPDSKMRKMSETLSESLLPISSKRVLMELTYEESGFLPYMDPIYSMVPSHSMEMSLLNVDLCNQTNKRIFNLTSE